MGYFISATLWLSSYTSACGFMELFTTIFTVPFCCSLLKPIGVM